MESCNYDCEGKGFVSDESISDKNGFMGLIEMGFPQGERKPCNDSSTIDMKLDGFPSNAYYPSESYVLKKKVKMGLNSLPNSHCQVHGCKKDLTSCKDYYRRHKVCEVHSKTVKVIVNGIEQRFCQQCSRFHLLGEFDDGKRSCRKRLAGHNKRRRKPHLGIYQGGNGRLLQSYNGTGNMIQWNSLPSPSSIPSPSFIYEDLAPEILLKNGKPDLKLTIPPLFCQSYPMNTGINSVPDLSFQNFATGNYEIFSRGYSDSAWNVLKLLTKSSHAHSLLSSQSHISSIHQQRIPFSHISSEMIYPVGTNSVEGNHSGPMVEHVEFTQGFFQASEMINVEEHVPFDDRRFTMDLL